MDILFTNTCIKFRSFHRHIFLSLVVAAFLLVMPLFVLADTCTEGTLPSNDSRYPQDQLTLICMPTAWNGVLFVYAHGYEAPYEPLALPSVQTGGFNLAAALMNDGFAFATSSYHKNGWAVEQAGNDLNNLVAYFNSISPIPALKVIVLGGSEGGLITTMLIEKYPDIYDGGIALCGPLGGANLEIQYLGDFRAVFDYFFPDIFNFGIVKGIPDDVYLYEDFYAAQIAFAFQNFPEKVEQLFNVTNVPHDLGGDPEVDLRAALSLLGYSVMGFNDLAEVASGYPYSNQFRRYSGSDNDFLLNRLVERVRPNLRGKFYLLKYYQPTGKLERPLITAHTTHDPIVPVWHQLIYSTLVKFNHAEDMHVAITVPRYGHCEFEPQELQGMIGALMTKLGVSGL